jgi:hypothetical protein
MKIPKYRVIWEDEIGVRFCKDEKEDFYFTYINGGIEGLSYDLHEVREHLNKILKREVLK